MKQWPIDVLLRVELLNQTRDGPVRQNDFVKFARNWDDRVTVEGIHNAARHLGLMTHDLGQYAYWVRPANLFALWWGNRPAHYYEGRQQRAGGGAA